MVLIICLVIISEKFSVFAVLSTTIAFSLFAAMKQPYYEEGKADFYGRFSNILLLIIAVLLEFELISIPIGTILLFVISSFTFLKFLYDLRNAG